MTPPYIRVDVGGGAVHFIPNPKSDRHWQMRYNQSIDQQLNAVMILESFDYLLCDEISQTEAIRRLKLLRKARTNPPNTVLDREPPLPVRTDGGLLQDGKP
jgi:hypothetical protein